MTSKQNTNRDDILDTAPRIYFLDKFSAWASKIKMMPQPVLFIIAIIILAFIATLNLLTGSEISFSVFYLLPVVFAGVFISRRTGYFLACACATIWGMIDYISGHSYSAVWIHFWNSGVRLGFFLIVNELIDMLNTLYAQTSMLSRTDTLTGLANARVFHEVTHQVIAQSRRNGQPFTVTYVDLDRFKQVNDKLGHSEGDRVLKLIATIIGEGVRTTDLVARLGGDEFAILMPDTGMEHVQNALERIAATITNKVEILCGVGATFGSVTFIKPPDSVDTAIRHADALMYRGKSEGRGCILHAIWPETVISQGQAQPEDAADQKVVK